MTLKIKVKPTYRPILDLLPKTTFPNASPVLILGKVHFEPNSYIKDFLSGIVPVDVVVVGSNGAKVVLKTFTKADGRFQVTYSMSERQYGRYIVLALHPFQNKGTKTECSNIGLV